MCESFNLQYGTNYIAVMPTNLYGPNDNFDLEILAMAYGSFVYSSGEVSRTSSFIGCSASRG